MQFVASVLGKVPAPYYAAYVAAKHGVVGLSGSLRQELRPRAQMERAPRGPTTKGAVHSPSSEGTDVRGGQPKH